MYSGVGVSLPIGSPLVNGDGDDTIPFIYDRYFRRNEGTTDYVSFPLYSTSTNCEISFDAYTDLSGVFYGFGNSGNFNNRISIDVNGGFGIRTSSDTNAFIAPSGTIPANIFTSIRIRLIGTNLEVFVNDVSIGTNTVSGGGFDINQLFRNDVNVNGKGIIANFKITDNGVLVRDYPLDDNSSDLRELVSGQNGTVINGTADQWVPYLEQLTGEWLGPELVVNGGFDSGTDNWTVFEGGNAQVVTGISSVNLISGGDLASVQQLVLSSSLTYRAVADVGVVSIGTLSLNNDGGGGDFDLSQTSLNTWEFVAIGSGFDARRKTGAGAANGFINSISVKEVLNVA